MTRSNDAGGAGGGATTTAEPKSPKWIPINEELLYVPRKIRVVCVGAGYSGLMLAYKYKHQMPCDDYVDLCIYEKNPEIGGTWLENRYPGVACDVPAHIYTFSWEPNPDWSTFYAQGPEIWEYLRRTATKYSLDDKVQLNSKVVSSVWDDTKGKWLIEVQRADGSVTHDEADVLVNGSGILNRWRWPDIAGLHSFQGKVLHSAAWDESVDWSGLRVGLIGNGSSAIQILPTVQPTAAHTTNYVRTPTWISVPFSAQFTPEGKNFTYTAEQKQRFKDHPEELHKLRKGLEAGFNKFFASLIVGSPEHVAAEAVFRKSMQDRLGNDPELCAKLIPEWSVGCRRLTPGEGYLEALQASNVTLEFSHIKRVTPTGIETANGHHEPLDIIMCATGFDVSFTPHWDVVGRGGIHLAEQWKDEPTAYFGICAPNMPNYFVINGPNSPVGHGSLLSAMEWSIEYILRWCQKIAAEDIKSITANAEATAEYNVYTQEFMKRTAWKSGCRSWYKNNRIDGNVTALYAGSILHYKALLESFRTEDFDFQYRSPNRFNLMGNGFTKWERDGGDLSFYLKM